MTAQHGVVSRPQLLGLGFTSDAIKHWIAVGYFIRVERNVYAVGRGELTREGHWMAAVLSFGPGALLSHLSAAALWGLLDTSATRIDISLPSHRRSRSRDGYRVHHTRLHPSDIRSKAGIPTTSPMRTLLDLADVVSPNRVRHAYDHSKRLGFYDLRVLEALLDRSPGRRGLKVVRGLIAEGRDDPPDVRSGLELDFLDLLRNAGLPLPATNVVVEGYSVDCYWPDAGLVVELDSWGYHRSHEAFEKDREQTEDLQRAGLTVLRFTDRRLSSDSPGVVQTVRRFLALKEEKVARRTARP